MNVPMNPAEALLNYIVHHTDLYMRRKKGVTEEQLWKRAFDALRPWLQELCEKVRREEREACAMCVDEPAASTIRARSTALLRENALLRERALTQLSVVQGLDAAYLDGDRLVLVFDKHDTATGILAYEAADNIGFTGEVASRFRLGQPPRSLVSSSAVALFERVLP